MFLLLSTIRVGAGEQLGHGTQKKYDSPQGSMMLVFDIAIADKPRDIPLLRLKEDGTVLVRSTTNPTSVIKGHLSQDEIQKLFDYIIHQKDFYLIQARDFTNLYEASKPDKNGVSALGLSRLADAPTTFIETYYQGKSHEVSLYGLASAVGQAPKNINLMHLREIELHLLGIAEKFRNISPL